MIAERLPRGFWIDGIAGAATFAVAHVIEIARWRAWFDGTGAYQPWFLNSGRAAAFTAACFFGVGVLTRMWGRSDPVWVRPAAAAAGGVVALAVTLAIMGGGNLFPIVITFGALVVSASVFAGWAIVELG